MCFARWGKDILRLLSTAKHSAQAQNPFAAAIYAMGARMRQQCASEDGRCSNKRLAESIPARRAEAGCEKRWPRAGKPMPLPLPLPLPRGRRRDKGRRRPIRAFARDHSE